MRNILAEFHRNRDGATAMEYALIAAGISVAIIAAVYIFGGDLAALFAGFSARLSG